MIFEDSIVSPASLLSSYFTRYQKPARSNLKLSSNIILSPSNPDVIYPVLPPRAPFKLFVSLKNTIDVDPMLNYYKIIDPESYVPMNLLHDYLKEGLKAEFEEYRDMPLSGNSICLIDKGEGLACRGGTNMDTVCKFL
jgi:hypothetical protein